MAKSKRLIEVEELGIDNSNFYCQRDLDKRQSALVDLNDEVASVRRATAVWSFAQSYFGVAHQSLCEV
jgi:hypothetical protein